MSAVAALRRQLLPAVSAKRLGHIGLHFAEDQLHAVQLRRSQSGGFCVRAWTSVPYVNSRDDVLGSTTRMKSLIDIAFKKARFKGRKVIAALPPDKFKVTSLNYQLDGNMPEAQRVIRLIAERLPGSIEDYVVDYLPVRGSVSDKERVALVATSSRSEVTQFLQVLDRSGLDVQELEVGPAALNRVVGILAGQTGHHGNTLIVNYGAKSTYLTVISGRRLLLDKEVEFGSQVLLEEVARRLDVNLAMAQEIATRQGLSQSSLNIEMPAGAGIDDINPVVEIVKPLFGKLIDEVRRACLYATSETQGEPVQQVFTFGSISRWPGADEMLSRTAKIPVADVLPVAAIFDQSDTGQAAEYAGIGPELAIATGLALRGMTDDA